MRGIKIKRRMKEELRRMKRNGRNMRNLEENEGKESMKAKGRGR
jgi:hypothetical protein